MFDESFLEVIRIGLVITFSNFEEYSVDGSGDDASSDWTDPVDLQRVFKDYASTCNCI